MKKIFSAVLICYFAGAIPGFGQNLDTFFTQTQSFLTETVKDGKVMYSSIKKDPQDLYALLELAKSVRVAESDTASYQAFWINSYNLLVIKGIIENYPVVSPLDIPGFFDKTEHEIAGVKITLNDIENLKLRAVFPAEPRFHFVLVCAGLGCPPIINRVYLPDSLEEQLEQQTAESINNPEFIRVRKNRVEVSQIFEWYAEDFNRNGNTLPGFINRYRAEPLPAKAKFSYYAYDWALNDVQ